MVVYTPQQSNVRAIKEVSEILEDTEGLEKNNLNFYSFTNESAVEHCFTSGVQQTQYSVLRHNQYARQKVDSGANQVRIHQLISIYANVVRYDNQHIARYINVQI